MIEIWEEIPGFENYSVSNFGTVFNEDTRKNVRPSQNQSGATYVGLVKDHKQFKRGLALLVAKTFLPIPQHDREHFDTPIHLDGDKTNCRVDNLAWRPRWFAINYHLQFPYRKMMDVWPSCEEINTKEVFETTWDAAMKYGLLEIDVRKSFHDQRSVFPSDLIFRQVSVNAWRMRGAHRY